MITVTKAVSKDIPQILELYTDLFQEKCDTETAIKKYEALLNNKDYMLLVAKEADEVLGTSVVIICSSIVENFLVVEDVVVKRDNRGKGIGRIIFDKIDTIAKEYDCNYSLLVSSGFRKNAHIFYENMGYIDDVRGFRKVYHVC